MYKKALFLIPALACAAIKPSLGIETGIGWERITQSSRVNASLVEGKYKRLLTFDVGLSARLDLNHLYFIGQTRYRTFLTTPTFNTYANGTLLLPIKECTREYGIDYNGYFGYDFTYGSFTVAPEVGLAYQRLVLNRGSAIAIGAPFAGFHTDWRFTRHWRLSTFFNYSFLGWKREDVPDEPQILSTTRFETGLFAGPAAGLSFGYSYVDKWNIILGFNVKYLESSARVFTTDSLHDDASTSWLRASSHVEITYNF